MALVLGRVNPGIIPARAGFTTDYATSAVDTKDHPRSRGVYGGRADSGGWAGGSSPLARGLHGRDEIEIHFRGIIPARAGFTNQRKDTGRAAQDHPRSRGVYLP